MGAGKTIGFRLDPDQVDALTEAAKAHGTSPGDYARTVVLAALSDGGRQEILTELAALRTEMEAMEAMRREMGKLAGARTGGEELKALQADIGKLAGLRADIAGLRAEVKMLAAESEKTRQMPRLEKRDLNGVETGLGEVRTELKRLREPLAKLATQEELDEVRQDVAAAALAILSSCRLPVLTQKEDKERWQEDSRKWVNKNLKG